MKNAVSKGSVWVLLGCVTGYFVYASCGKEVTADESMPCMSLDTITELTGNNSVWTEHLGNDTTVMAFPDLFANYWTYSFKNPGQNIGIRINGEFGNCRYLNYAVYKVPSSRSMSSLKDVDILTDCGNDNPFILQNNNGSRLYRIHILPDYETDDQSWWNVIKYDADADSISVFLRYYLPEGDKYASVELPKVEAFSTITGETLPLPESFSLKDIRFNFENISTLLTSFFKVETVPDKIIRFYNINSDYFFANPDNLYLATPITKNENEVYMIRFKSPSYASDMEDNSTANVRYWSITQSDVSTRSFSGLRDEEAIIAGDGYVNIVIAEDTPQNRSKAAGLNFMPWNVKSGKMILIYRNMLTKSGFTGAFTRVPKLDGSNSLNVFIQAADAFIGDYAPKGKRMITDEYLENFGGFTVSY
jgi:hypothetical protein